MRSARMATLAAISFVALVTGACTAPTSPPTTTTPGADVTAPVLFLPTDISYADPGPGGMVVSYTANAVDKVDGPMSATCTPPSGSSAPFGVTTVQCSATDAAANTATGSFTVRVHDGVTPVLALPSTVTVEASARRAPVATYTTSAVDAVDGPRPVSCDPKSGSLFPLGSTIVECWAGDARGTPRTTRSG